MVKARKQTSLQPQQLIRPSLLVFQNGASESFEIYSVGVAFKQGSSEHLTNEGAPSSGRMLCTGYTLHCTICRLHHIETLQPDGHPLRDGDAVPVRVPCGWVNAFRTLEWSTYHVRR